MVHGRVWTLAPSKRERLFSRNHEKIDFLKVFCLDFLIFEILKLSIFKLGLGSGDALVMTHSKIHSHLMGVTNRHATEL